MDELFVPDGEAVVVEVEDAFDAEPTPAQKLAALAAKEGDLSEAFTLESLLALGNDVVEDYERDLKDRHEWAETAKESLQLAAQEHKDGKKDFPWKGASNVRFPLLTTAALQFNARAYPAIVKGDEAVSCKVVGQDKGRPQMGQDGHPMAMGPQGPISAQEAAQLPPEIQEQLAPAWAVPPGGKAARARRVAEYMNTTLFYRMEDWESDTDSLLIQLPIVGCAFRKVWYDPITRKQKSVLVPALRILVPEGARSCDTTPRLTEEIPDVYPHEIRQKQRSGFYRDITLAADGDNEDNPRLLLEQHRLMDLDGDGLEERYVVTVDHSSRRVLRIEANFGPDDIRVGDDGQVLGVEARRFYVKYGFFPHPEGKFYDIGLGHLLKQLGDVIDTAINQIIDTGTAQAAGGGFIGSGVRLQARGGGSTIRFAPGEYKTVDAPGNALREAIYERTLPNVSPVTFQVLDLILGAARDITSVKDVITGEASNTGQVGTTLALIEQGLQVFTAIYKRVYRSLKQEFTLLYENIGRYGGEDAARDYSEVMDDPEARFEQDFNSRDLDIRPVSDPTSVTRMQRMAKGQFLMSTIEAAVAAGGNPQEIMRRVYEAADVEDIDKIFPPQPPADPMQGAMAEGAIAKLGAEVAEKQASAALKGAQAEKARGDTLLRAIETGASVASVA